MRKRTIGAVLLCVAAVSTWGFRHLGYWLQADDPLQHSRAIVVLGGGTPYRAIEAGRLFRSGWAPEVWVTQGAPDLGDRLLAGIGIPVSHEHERSEEILVALGVPQTAIRRVPTLVDNTVSELRAIAAFAGPDSHTPLIVVTSKYHARRVRVVWNSVAHLPMLVRYTRDDTYNAARWWGTSTDAISTFRELFGIMNAWAGFPVTPKRE